MVWEVRRLILEGDIGSYQIKDKHIATGGLRVTKWKYDEGVSAPIPDAPTVIPHGLGEIPKIVIITETTRGVMGYVQENIDVRSASSITLVANVSGPVVEWKVLA